MRGRWDNKYQPRDWHKYFAWRKIYLNNGETIWLEWVERRTWFGPWLVEHAEYREIGSDVVLQPYDLF